VNPDAPEATGNRATRRAAARRGRKLAALGSGAVLATGAAAGAVATFASSAGAATTIAVTNTNDSGAGSLRDALANANTGDSIDLTGVSGQITLTSGELVIEDAVTISGPGPAVLAISGNNASRVFQMESDLSGGTVTISGVTITGGFEDSAQGAGINFYCGSTTETGNLVVDNVSITGNTADDLGAGLYFDRCDDSNLTILNSTIAGNTALSSGGGGIWFDEGNTLTIQNSTIAGNNGGFYGGGLYFDNGVNLVVISSTFSDNHASQAPDAAGEGAGGAIQITDLTGLATIANSTFTGNTSDLNGGAINVSSGNIEVLQATISGNTATGAGDGLYLGYGSDSDAAADHTPRGKQGDDEPVASALAAGSVVVTGSIVAGNADGTDDIAAGEQSGTTATIASSVIGAVNGVAVTDGGGNQLGVLDPGLDALASNGGPTQTMALKPGSPAIDAGPDPVPDFPANEFDQRGPGFPRVVNGTVDVGAFEVQPAAPAPDVIVITPRFTG
jgi:Right handed beta helix region